MENKIIFYTNPMSRGRIVRWMLEELDVAYDTKILEYDTTMKGAEYLAINPMGKVPAIVHNGALITETAAICTYLADVFAGKGLAPITNEEKARYYRWMYFAAGPVEQAIGIHSLGVELTPKLQISLGCGNPQDTINTLAKAVSQSDYITGDRFTAADVYIGSHVGFGMMFGSLPKLPEFVAYWERVSHRPAKIKANEIDDALMKS